MKAIVLNKQATKPTPRAGKVIVYADDNGNVFALNDDGSESTLLPAAVSTEEDTVALELGHDLKYDVLPSTVEAPPMGEFADGASYEGEGRDEPEREQRADLDSLTEEEWRAKPLGAVAEHVDDPPIRQVGATGSAKTKTAGSKSKSAGSKSKQRGSGGGRR